MAGAMIEAAKIVVYGAAAAAVILLIGGAVKKVANDSGDDCLKAGTDLARSVLGSVSLGSVEPTEPRVLPCPVAQPPSREEHIESGDQPN